MRRILGTTLLAGLAAFAIACPAAAAAEPTCPNTDTVILQGEPLPRQGTVVCDDDTGGDGLLGNAPVVGDLPGLSGVL